MDAGNKHRMAQELIALIRKDERFFTDRLPALRREPDHPVFGIIKHILRAGIRGGREETDHGIV